MKTQIDWTPLSIGAVRPVQGRTLALMQVSGGSQLFDTLVQKAYEQIEEDGRMKDSRCCCAIMSTRFVFYAHPDVVFPRLRRRAVRRVRRRDRQASRARNFN